MEDNAYPIKYLTKASIFYKGKNYFDNKSDKEPEGKKNSKCISMTLKKVLFTKKHISLPQFPTASIQLFAQNIPTYLL